MVHKVRIERRRGVVHKGERILGIEIRVVIECRRDISACPVVSTYRTIGTQQQIGQCIGLPLHADVTPPVVATRELLRITVREGTVRLRIEVLRGVLVHVVTVTVVPAHGGVHLQLLTVVVVQVGAQHLTGVQSATVPPTCILLLVIEVAQQHETRLVRKARSHATRGIAMIRATGDVEVSHEATVHAFLDCEVDDGLLLAVLNTSDAGLV